MIVSVNTVERQADDTDREQQRGTLCWLNAGVNRRRGGKDGISLVSWEGHVTDVPLTTGYTNLDGKKADNKHENQHYSEQ